MSNKGINRSARPILFMGLVAGSLLVSTRPVTPAVMRLRVSYRVPTVALLQIFLAVGYGALC